MCPEIVLVLNISTVELPCSEGTDWSCGPQLASEAAASSIFPLIGKWANDWMKKNHYKAMPGSLLPLR